jgi:hypothetical protein
VNGFILTEYLNLGLGAATAFVLFCLAAGAAILTPGRMPGRWKLYVLAGMFAAAYIWLIATLATVGGAQ